MMRKGLAFDKGQKDGLEGKGPNPKLRNLTAYAMGYRAGSEKAEEQAFVAATAKIMEPNTEG